MSSRMNRNRGTCGPAAASVAGSASNGLRNASTAPLTMSRSGDKRRVDRVYGAVSRAELAAIDAALRLFLGMSAS